MSLYVTEYAPGGDLKQIANEMYKGRINEHDMKFFTTEIICALRGMHKVSL